MEGRSSCDLVINVDLIPFWRRGKEEEQEVEDLKKRPGLSLASSRIPPQWFQEWIYHSSHDSTNTSPPGGSHSPPGGSKAHRGAQTALVALFCFSFYRRLVLSVISLFSRLLSHLLPKRMVVNGGKVEHSLLWSCIREVFQGLALNDSAKKLTHCLFSLLKSCQETNKTHWQPLTGFHCLYLTQII